MERSSSKTSASGIIDDPNAINNGQGTKQRIIPESRRADGSIRKERKVRPGFTPVEDVARFVPSRVRQARAEATAGVSKSSTNTNGVANREMRNSGASSRTSTPSEARKSDRKSMNAVEPPSKTSEATQQTESLIESPRKTSAISKAEEIKRPATKDLPDSWDDDTQSNDKAHDSIDEIAKELQSINIKSEK
ncbi:hypothetical protein L7F22_027283 [Adiantum nelumboides]|nr:hypothetical protein [Adiantum nelumboides]